MQQRGIYGKNSRQCRERRQRLYATIGHLGETLATIQRTEAEAIRNKGRPWRRTRDNTERGARVYMQEADAIWNKGHTEERTRETTNSGGGNYTGKLGG